MTENNDPYTFHPTTEDIIVFKDFNFKLEFLDELMYYQNRLKPPFDLYDFVKH